MSPRFAIAYVFTPGTIFFGTPPLVGFLFRRSRQQSNEGDRFLRRRADVDHDRSIVLSARGRGQFQTNSLAHDAKTPHLRFRKRP